MVLSTSLTLVLWVFAFVCWFLAVVPLGQPNWNRLVAAGLTFMAAAVIFGEGYRAFSGGIH